MPGQKELLIKRWCFQKEEKELLGSQSRTGLGYRSLGAVMFERKAITMDVLGGWRERRKRVALSGEN